jgi:hypothetical protein
MRLLHILSFSLAFAIPFAHAEILRPVDVAGRGHEGDTSYDMGCFEFQLSPADLDADGYVNEWDLILFQEQWHDLE